MTIVLDEKTAISRFQISVGQLLVSPYFKAKAEFFIHHHASQNEFQFVLHNVSRALYLRLSKRRLNGRPTGVLIGAGNPL